MKFGNVEIPATLIDSLKHNRVIVFAGAGVSMATPANLPDFVTLTRLCCTKLFVRSDSAI